MERHIPGYKQSRSTRPARRRWNRKRFWVLLTIALLAPIALAGTAGGLFVYRVSRSLPDIHTLTRHQPSQTTEIYSSDGLLLARLFDENREVVPLEQIPRELRDATTAIEDHRFYSHRGVDWRGTVRALAANARNSGYVQGGSTITQQLVRNVYLSPDKNLTRKVKEALLAIRAERAFSKPQILGMYLNQVYYGQRCFGVEAASRRYFGKSARSLTLAEAALLAGIPQRPSLYDPYANRDAAQKRRNLVLQRMAEVGFIPEKRARAAINQPVRLAYTEPPRLTARRAHYFVDHVVRELEERYGAEKVFRGGLRVQTTLNTRAQEAAERAVARNMDARFGRRSRTQDALISIDPTNGYVRAMVGGRNYRRSMFNRAARAKRQPGSTFKPFVYAAALGSGFSPGDRITDAPVRFAGEDWRPRNYDGRWHGRVTLTEALSQSINIPAIKLLNEVGPNNVMRLARACGIESPLHEGLSLALGASEVSVMELAGAYTVFAAGGAYTPPVSIVRVRDGNGHLLESHFPHPTVVLDDTVARRMDFMLRQVVRVGTGRPAASIPNARGKTGTTNELKDAWFVGYTPSLVTVVWVGNDTPSRIPGLTGGGACAPIWVSYMRQAEGILPRRPLPPALRPPKPPSDHIYVADAPYSKGVDVYETPIQASADAASGASEYGSEDAIQRRVCLISGQLATVNCTETDVESFATGMEPLKRCTLHTAEGRAYAADASLELRADMDGDVVLLCRATGGLAGPSCRDLVTAIIADGKRYPKPCPRHGRRLGQAERQDMAAAADASKLPGDS